MLSVLSVLSVYISIIVESSQYVVGSLGPDLGNVASVASVATWQRGNLARWRRSGPRQNPFRFVY